MYIVHWPVALKTSAVFPGAGTDFASAEEAPMRETWGAIKAAHAEGLTRHVGVSNFSAKKIKDLLAHAKVKPEVNQVELHPFLQQSALVDYCTSQSIHVTGYSPLGSGDRPAFPKAATDPVPLENAFIKAIAGAHGCTPAQVLLAFRGGEDRTELHFPFACSAASARTLVPVISRITEWCTRRSITAAVVMGSLKIRSHSLKTTLLVMITLRRS